MENNSTAVGLDLETLAFRIPLIFPFFNGKSRAFGRGIYRTQDQRGLHFGFRETAGASKSQASRKLLAALRDIVAEASKPQRGKDLGVSKPALL